VGATPRGWSLDCTLDIESLQEELQENPSHNPREGCTNGTAIPDDGSSCGNDRSAARPTSSFLYRHAGRWHTSPAFFPGSSHPSWREERTEASHELDCETTQRHSRPGPKPASVLSEVDPSHGGDPCPCDILFHVRLGFNPRMSAWIFASIWRISASVSPDVRLGFGRYLSDVRFIPAISPGPTTLITPTDPITPTDVTGPTDLPDRIDLPDGTDLLSYHPLHRPHSPHNRHNPYRLCPPNTTPRGCGQGRPDGPHTRPRATRAGEPCAGPLGRASGAWGPALPGLLAGQRAGLGGTALQGPAPRSRGQGAGIPARQPSSRGRGGTGASAGECGPGKPRESARQPVGWTRAGGGEEPGGESGSNAGGATATQTSGRGPGLASQRARAVFPCPHSMIWLSVTVTRRQPMRAGASVARFV